MHIGGGGGGGDGSHLHRHHDTNQSKVRFTQTNSFVGLLDDGDEAEGGGGSSEQKRDVRGADGEIDTSYSSLQDFAINRHNPQHIHIHNILFAVYAYNMICSSMAH